MSDVEHLFMCLLAFCMIFLLQLYWCPTSCYPFSTICHGDAGLNFIHHGPLPFHSSRSHLSGKFIPFLGVLAKVLKIVSYESFPRWGSSSLSRLMFFTGGTDGHRKDSFLKLNKIVEMSPDIWLDRISDWMDMNLSKQSTGKPSVLQSTGSQRVGHDLATKNNSWYLEVV